MIWHALQEAQRSDSNLHNAGVSEGTPNASPCPLKVLDAHLCVRPGPYVGLTLASWTTQ